VLDAYSSSITGRVLNVGALPEQRRAETTDFLAPDVEVVEIDIDPARKPHLLGDITRVSERLDGTFDAVLLFALGAFHSPSLVVATVRRLLKSGGIALFGFTADSHPSRGGLWRPFDRPIWRAEREPLGKIGLRGSLWSFDEQAVQTLFGDWPGAEYEYHGSGMYYVVAPGA
jgi:SAM-dependent methyltransferase